MTAFETEVSVMSATVGSPTEEALKAGVTPHIELAITSGLVLPFANPQTGEPLIVPAGKYKFALGREQAIEVFRSALEAAEKLPEANASSGKVLVASNMAQVEQAAQNIHRVTGR